MKTIRNERYQESYDVETLDNGLRVVIWHKPGYARSLFMMATPLGAMDICQVRRARHTVRVSGRHRAFPRA